ncbi:aldehyde dehydrogenase family protein, partial [Arthrobacter sp. IA7]|uniref:aldehyde dehydrogenase family protein n=1 Tax=Arthrobacter ipis TaxID=2716202 RepID=UPI0016858219
ADAVERSAEELARLLSREQGKPLNGPNARFEVGACAAWLRNTATTELTPEVIVDDGETYAELHYKPIGVVGAIGPWNWPMMITIWQIAPALRMGNTAVVKPSKMTPLSVLALIKVLNEELPDGVLTAISGDREVGARLAEHPAIGKIMFTRSAEEIHLAVAPVHGGVDPVAQKKKEPTLRPVGVAGVDAVGGDVVTDVLRSA